MAAETYTDGARGFELTVLTMDRLVFRRRVYGVTLPASLGSMGVLPGHIPYLATLGRGDLRVKAKESDQPAKIADVDGGFVEVEKGRVTVFADSVEGVEPEAAEE